MKRPHVPVDSLAVSARCYSTVFAADQPVRDEGATTCCDAQSEKSWITDPERLHWESFLTAGETTVYGGSADLGPIRVASATCRAPTPSA